MDMALIIKKIELGGQAIMSDIINDLISDHQAKHDKMLSNYKRYKASRDPDGVPVFSRRFEDANKINNMLNNSFDGDIVDVKIGYMIGVPIIYEAATETDKSDIAIFNTLNNIEDLDGETLKLATICGYGARLLYINKEGVEKVVDIKPWECIFVEDGSISEAQYALRYFEITDGDKKKTFVEWYDSTHISFYISKYDTENRLNDVTYIPYVKDGETVIPHMFNGVPLIRFNNNAEEQGDCDKVYSLIDGYDSTISDVNSELAQLRLAYMAFYGLVPDEATMKLAQKTGAFGLADPESKVGFITKDINDTAVENHLNRIEENIYKFAKSVNFSDEAFAGNVSGIAMKFKMFSLEAKCIISERKFDTGLRNMYKILFTAWNLKGTSINYLDIDFVWTRNFPLNLLDESKTTTNLRGQVSEETRLGLLSFVDDPETEIEKMKEDNEDMINLNKDDDEEEDEGNEENND